MSARNAAQVVAAAGLSVLVTGAQGFIGAHVCQRLLAAGVRVSAWARANADGGCRAVDLCDAVAVRAALREAAPDCVLHLAADAIRREEPHASEQFDNADTTRILLEALAEQVPAAAFVLASSESVYGPAEGRVFDENCAPAPNEPYALSKRHCEQLTDALWTQAGRRSAVVRLSNIYGGGDRHRSRLVPGAVLAVLGGQPPTLRSSAAVTRDFLFIDDAVHGLLAIAAGVCLTQHGQGIFNLASGQATSIGALACDIARIAGRPDLAPELPAQLESLPPRRVAIERVRALYGWTPEVPLQEGLARTVSWYRENIAVIGET
jgi:nucleoside-diphosphate-sugar epimerase